MRYIHCERVYIPLTGTDDVRFVVPVDAVREVKQLQPQDDYFGAVSVTYQLAGGPLNVVQVKETLAEVLERLEFGGGAIATTENVAQWRAQVEASERGRRRMEAQLYSPDVDDLVGRRRRPD